jgi:hypothetical protein
LKKQRTYSPSLTIDRFLVHVQECLRDTARPFTSGVFTAIARDAKKVLGQWRQQGQLLPLVLSLFVGVELRRLQFIANPTQRHLLYQARTRLDAAKYLCDLAIERYKGEQKKLAQYLSFYCNEGEVAIALDAGEPDQAAESIRSIQRRANTVMEAHGEGEIFATTRFLSSLTQAEYHMKLQNFNEGYRYLTTAEQARSSMQSGSFEADIMVAYVKAALGLASGDDHRYEDLCRYSDLCHRFPFLTHVLHLQALKRAYPEDCSQVLLPTSDRLMVDTLFRHIQTHIFAM